jgi:hypothetical protein
MGPHSAGERVWTHVLHWGTSGLGCSTFSVKNWYRAIFSVARCSKLVNCALFFCTGCSFERNWGGELTRVRLPGLRFEAVNQRVVCELSVHTPPPIQPAADKDLIDAVVMRLFSHGDNVCGEKLGPNFE